MSNKEINQEPIFKGSFEDFKIFLGDYVKNSVPELTKKYKDALGKCECCNAERSKKKPLDTAHITDRPVLIKEAFEKATIEKDGDIHTVDLNIFCIYNKLRHYDYNNFYILCKKCHDDSHGKISKEELNDLKNKWRNDYKIKRKKEVQKRKKEFADTMEKNKNTENYKLNIKKLNKWRDYYKIKREEEVQKRKEEFADTMEKNKNTENYKLNIKKLEEIYQSNLEKILDECKNKLNTNGSEKLKEIIEYINEKKPPQNS